MPELRLDQYLQKKGLVGSRTQAENYIKLGYVRLNGRIELGPETIVSQNSLVILTAQKTYVSRAALKLEPVPEVFNINFNNKVVLDVGSSTGGFSDLALSLGASKVIAVEVGKNQMDSRLRMNTKIELHEQTDIRSLKSLSTKVNIVLIDVSFISLREILPHIITLVEADCEILAMVKPQFESSLKDQKQRGVIKNESIRRKVFKEFELWSKQYLKIEAKLDSSVLGKKGNREKFYLLKPLKK